MFGPRRISTCSGRSAGGMIMRSSTRYVSRQRGSARARPASRGSMISPAMAAAAQAAGLGEVDLMRPCVPQRPSKLRLNERTETAPDGGTAADARARPARRLEDARAGRRSGRPARRCGRSCCRPGASRD